MNRTISARCLGWALACAWGLAVVAGCGPAEPPRSSTPASRQEGPEAKPLQPAPAKSETGVQPETPAKTHEGPKPTEQPAATGPALAPAKSDESKGDESKNDKKASAFAGAKWKTEDTADEQRRPKQRDLGPPLVDHPESLTRLNPVFPTWIDAQHRRVVMVGEVVRSSYGLEMFISQRAAEKGYESVIEVDTQAALINAALLRLGLEPGSPVKYMPKYQAPSGPEVLIDLYWNDAKGQRQHARGQDWLKNVRTGKTLDANWVYTGSGFWKDESSGKEYFQAEGGYLVCVANTPSALLDLPIPSTGDLEGREFQPADSVPPKGTAVTIVLSPKGPAKK